jgi:hypothetical protein
MMQEGNRCLPELSSNYTTFIESSRKLWIKHLGGEMAEQHQHFPLTERKYVLRSLLEKTMMGS